MRSRHWALCMHAPGDIALGNARQGEVERCALAHLALSPSAAPVAADDPANVCQADARAFELLDAVQALKDAEQLVRLGHVEAYTVVPDVDHNLAGRLLDGSDFNAGGMTIAREL